MFFPREVVEETRKIVEDITEETIVSLIGSDEAARMAAIQTAIAMIDEVSLYPSKTIEEMVRSPEKRNLMREYGITDLSFTAGVIRGLVGKVVRDRRIRPYHAMLLEKIIQHLESKPLTELEEFAAAILTEQLIFDKKTGTAYESVIRTMILNAYPQLNPIALEALLLLMRIRLLNIRGEFALAVERGVPTKEVSEAEQIQYVQLTRDIQRTAAILVGDEPLPDYPRFI